MTRNNIRWIIGVAAIVGLIAVFIFQRIDFAAGVGLKLTYTPRFIFNRSIRFLLNDVFAMGLIYALFPARKYIVFALWVQLAGVILFLLPYFVLKVYYPKYNGPLISYLHRLILNPTLLLLLLPAFYYQENTLKKQ